MRLLLGCLWLLAVGALLSLSFREAVAQTAPIKYPLIAKERVSIAAGANYEWRSTPLSPQSEPLAGRHAEWTAGAYAAYAVTPHFSLIGSTVLGLDSFQFRHTLGVRVRLWSGLQ